MKYFATRNADSSEAKTINSKVAFYKTDTFIRNKYMTYEFDLHQSKEDGIAEGKEEKAREMARKLRDDGVSLDTISRCSGIPVEEIKAL